MRHLSLVGKHRPIHDTRLPVHVSGTPERCSEFGTALRLFRIDSGGCDLLYASEETSRAVEASMTSFCAKRCARGA